MKNYFKDKDISEKVDKELFYNASIQKKYETELLLLIAYNRFEAFSVSKK